MVGECSGKMRSMPTPKLTRRTVKVAPEARPFFEITTPSNACRRSFTFSPSPSWSRTFTRTVSPGRNSGRSLRSCASCSLRITGFMFLFPFRPTQAGANSSETIPDYRQIAAFCLADLPCLPGPSRTGGHQVCANFRLGRGHHGRIALANHGPRKSLHLFELRAELQQHQVNSSSLKFRKLLRHLFRCSNQPGPQAAIRNRIIFERNALFELRSRQPLLVVRVPRGGLLHVGDSPHFVLRLA